TLYHNITYFYSSLSDSYEQSLTSSASVVKRPGESVTLSCTVSGFSMSSYYMHWIRQKPGRGLEWIGRVDYGTGTTFAQSLQGQFSITKDTNKNMLYLEVKSLKAEDTAVYYCEMFFITSVCFIALLFSDVCGISLTSSPAEVKPPGSSVKLSCQISGYQLSSYGTDWIRQPPGKAMEWIGIIWGGGSIDSGASFKSRFSISRDTSKNVLYLDISNL
ncbi:hypothetical protein C0J45_24448, partial [Silurus meridionalis]